ncbi:MAG: tyrosine-type recombinase/integrase [Dehalococcoidia bacterium]|nr:tyrosine-type recombinase/integrase [Dehalococcoidia bacterium]
MAFIDDLRARGRRPATVAAYLADWRKFSRWSAAANGEPFDVSRLVAREVAEFRAAESAREQKAATINRCMAFLIEYTRWAEERGDIRAGLVRELQRIPRVVQQQLAPRGLTRVELRRLLKEVDVRASARDKAVVYLALYCGLRLGEVTHLRLEDVMLSERKGLVSVGGQWAKGGKARVVPIPATARKVLTDYLAVRGDAPGELFLGERGPLGRNGITRIVTKYGAAAGVKVSPHTLRHSFAFRYLAFSNNDLVGLADLMGHSNVNTTRHYARRRLEDLEQALEGMDF